MLIYCTVLGAPSVELFMIPLYLHIFEIFVKIGAKALKKRCFKKFKKLKDGYKELRAGIIKIHRSPYRISCNFCNGLIFAFFMISFKLHIFESQK